MLDITQTASYKIRLLSYGYIRVTNVILLPAFQLLFHDVFCALPPIFGDR